MVQPQYDNGIDITGVLEKRFNRNTPDYLDRKQEHTIPVFFYDNFKVGGEYFSLLNGLPYLGECRTVMDCFQMHQCSTSGMPIVRKLNADTKDVPMGSVFGDMFVLDPIALCEVDMCLKNNVMYKREQHWFWMDDQHNPLVKGKVSLKAWIYLRHNEFWKDRPLIARIPKFSAGKKSYRYPVNSHKEADTFWAM